MAGMAVLYLGIFLGGGIIYSLSVPSYLVLGLGGMVLATFAPVPRLNLWLTLALAAGLAAGLWTSWQLGGGDWAGWHDWLILGFAAGYFCAIFISGSGAIWLLAPLALLGLFQSIVILGQSSGIIIGHPLGWVEAGGVRAVGDNIRTYISGTLPSRTLSAASLNSIGFIALGQAMWGDLRAGARIATLWSAVVMLTAGLFCESRAAILGGSSGLVAFAALSGIICGRYASKRRGVYSLALVALLMLSSLGVAGLYSTNWGFQNRMDSLADDSYRVRLWVDALNEIKQEELQWGSGPGSFRQIARSVYRGDGDSVYAHNDWLQILLEYGLYGLSFTLLLFLFHIFAAVRGTARCASQLAATWEWPRSDYLAGLTGGASSLVTLGVHAFFDYPLHIPVLAALAGISAGFCVTSVHAESGRGGALGRTASLMAAAALLTLIVVSSSKLMPSDFLAWRAEQSMKSGDLEEAWSILNGRSNAKHGKQYLLAMGGVAVENARASASAAARHNWLSEAAGAYDSILSSEGGNYEALKGRGTVALLIGDHHTGQRFFRKMVTESPGDAMPYALIGLSYHLQGRLSDAENAYRVSLIIQHNPLGQDGINRLKNCFSAP